MLKPGNTRTFREVTLPPKVVVVFPSSLSPSKKLSEITSDGSEEVQGKGERNKTIKQKMSWMLELERVVISVMG
ncbi:hypothetical protein U1Q18_007384 [Sarracenia purpurea var. burkii]